MWKKEGGSGLTMMLTLTFMNRESCNSHDIQVNTQQKIIDTLLILKDANLIQDISKDKIKVKSLRKGMYVNIDHTYEGEHIHTSDILELIGGTQ